MSSRKQFIFSNGVTVIVKEASSAAYDYYMDMSADAQKAIYSEPALDILAKTYYPLLAACTDNVMPLEQVYQLDPCEIDSWWLVVCQVNSYWLSVPNYKQQVLEFSNGKKIEIKSLRPSITMRLAAIQKATEQGAVMDNVKDETYRITAYPGIAAASFGDVPGAYEARNELTLQESVIWHRTVRELIPEWYGDPVPDITQDETEEKKSDNQPAESLASS